MSRPLLRTISFDAASVDETGMRNPPEKYSAAIFTEALGLGAGLDMVSIAAGNFMMGSPLQSRSGIRMKVRNTMPHSLPSLLALHRLPRHSGLPWCRRILIGSMWT